MTFTSVFYHRALTHDAIELPSWLLKFITLTGMPLTGLDAKVWVCMHRLHHQHSDTAKDPHSPHTDGFFKLFLAQKNAYLNILKKLIEKDHEYENIISDLDMDLNWISRHNLWWLPHLIHLCIAFALSLYFQNNWLGFGYFFGIAGHPIQGWAVNSFGHAIGYRNFNSPDESRNNTLIAWLFFGEGYQNNHHHNPSSAKLSYKSHEFDPGFIMVKILAFFNIIKIKEIARA